MKSMQFAGLSVPLPDRAIAFSLHLCPAGRGLRAANQAAQLHDDYSWIIPQVVIFGEMRWRELRPGAARPPGFLFARDLQRSDGRRWTTCTGFAAARSQPHRMVVSPRAAAKPRARSETAGHCISIVFG